MLQPFFCKKDFMVCTVPVPDGYPQSQTHAGIAYHNGRFYLTCSPYPVKKYSRFESHWLSLLRKVSSGRWGKMLDAEKYENPMLYVGVGEKEAPPTLFEPLYPFPLMDTPLPVYGMPAYNSDPDIFIEDNKVYILNRTYYRRPSEEGANEKEVLVSLIRGGLNDNSFQLIDISEFKKSSDSLISPCLIKYRGKYLFMSLETNSAIDGRSFDGIYMQQSNTIHGLRGELEKKRIVIQCEKLLPWHMSLFTYKERLFAIVACVVVGDKSHIWQMLGEFNQDLSVLKIFQRPLTDFNSYRGAACVLDDNSFVLYSTTLRDRINNSKSIDGRDIIMTSCSFSELLNFEIG